MPCYAWGVITVSSSDLHQVDYDWSSTFTIVFQSGHVYEFYGVPFPEYAGLMNASSHGKYFHAHIKDQYNYRRIY
jgi:hypothetical protein